MKVKHYKYLNDENFLKEIDNLKVKEQFVKITALTWNDEIPIDEIQGKISTGSINFDGSSSVRRTANLTMLADINNYDVLNVNNIISINKKIELEIGFTNTTDKYIDYDIIWFPLGIYVIRQCSITHNNSGLNISLQLSDKMCLLNGQCGGILSAAMTFDSTDILDEDGLTIDTEHTPIYRIIQRLVYEYGGEQLGRIIINDIDNRIKKVMKWTGKEDIYLTGENNSYSLTLEKPEGVEYKTYSAGMDIGYVYSDFYYPSDLTSNAGEAITSVLDKIKNALGNFEYYYDIYGNFIFQEIKNYLNTSQATVDLKNIQNSDYLINRSKGKSVYQFNNGDLITSYSNNPQYMNIYNDYIVWGLQNTGGSGKVIRYHLAIDNKPTIGEEFTIIPHKGKDEVIRAKLVNVIKTDSLKKIKKPNKNDYYIVNNKLYTYDEDYQFFIYMEVNYNNLPELKEDELPDYPISIITTDWRETLYYQGLESLKAGFTNNYYYSEMNSEWPRVWNIIAHKTDGINENGLPIYNGDYITENKNDIPFFIDFIDSNAKISDFSVRNIGRRTKVVTDNSVNCVFAADVPDFIIIETNQPDTAAIREEAQKNGQPYIQVDSDIFSSLSIGGASNSAYEYIRSLLYQYTSYNESISLSVIPIYYLEPNTRITVQNKDASINGDYMIKSISLPLDVNGTMTLSCTKALERI